MHQLLNQQLDNLRRKEHILEDQNSFLCRMINENHHQAAVGGGDVKAMVEMAPVLSMLTAAPGVLRRGVVEHRAAAHPAAARRRRRRCRRVPAAADAAQPCRTPVAAAAASMPPPPARPAAVRSR
ncbi:hypothetical protein OsJ_05553 [Oryza sativa Japonica Group]|uniref:Uncharacterized protein n=1 Tax=Oryza sativa subsp. japonica TaxID=39947 RepID=B9F3A1_ORYSJ|nr:hypothetical protein OsJ_05553 [Oryza sativa Japonica Group]